MLREHEINFRVRYQETDAQGHVHHANYLTWFEMGRVELLRAAGKNYRTLEEEGVLLVISEVQINYFAPAKFDDEIRLVTRTLSGRGARIYHQYQAFRGETLLVEAKTTVACIDREGRVRRLPEWLQVRDDS